MDKYEFAVRTDKLKKMAEKGDYVSAAKIADAIDWSKVTDTRLLSTVADAYEKVGRYKEARETLLIAYEQVPVGRRMVYRLTELAVKEGNLAEAEDYFREYQEIAPNDTGKFVLRYEISAAKGEPLDKQISILEAYKRREFEERWAYELAALYQKAGRKEECVRLCDEIIVWFGDGEYVNKAKALKEKYGIYTADRSDSVLPPLQETDKHGITEQWNVAALQQQQELSENLAAMMKEEPGYTDPEFDEEGFAAKLGKTKEVKLPIVPEATRELNDIHDALAYAGEVIPSLDLDVIKEAAEEEHQKNVTEHRRWDPVWSGGATSEVKRTGAKTAEFIPDHREELPDDTGDILGEELAPEAPKAPDTPVSGMQEKLPEETSVKPASSLENESGKEELSYGAASEEDPQIPADMTLEELLKQAENMLSSGEESPRLDLESALSAAEAEAGEDLSYLKEAVSETTDAYDRRPKISAPDSVVNMLEEEREARLGLRRKEKELQEEDAKEALDDSRSEEAAPDESGSEETAQEEAPSLAGDRSQEEEQARAEKPAEEETENKAKEKPMEANSGRAGAAPAAEKKAARCAFLEASDESTRTERAMESIRKLHERRGTEAGRAARVSASRLNERGVSATFAKLGGRDLIVENASVLAIDTVEDLARELREKDEDNVIVLVDTAAGISKLIPSCDALRGICSYIREKASVKSTGQKEGASKGAKKPAPAQGGKKAGASRDEEAPGKARAAAQKAAPVGEMSMRDFAKCVEDYAHQLECELDDKASLAIYARAEQLMDDGIVLSEAVAKDITDEAVELAEKPSLRGVFSGKYNKDGFLILREEHFMHK